MTHIVYPFFFAIVDYNDDNINIIFFLVLKVNNNYLINDNYSLQ